MPSIRKKTSNRASTNDRKKTQHKVKESRKKKAKAAKKNPQWKSKHKKDPGIPNNFPYKDEILAEVAEQRRIAAEEKQRRKDQKKGAKVKEAAGDEESSGEDEIMTDVPISKDLNVGLESIAGLSAKRLIHAKAQKRPEPVVVQEKEEEEKVPILINRDLPNLQAVLGQADVVVQILDARDPLSFRSAQLEEAAAAKSGRKILLILNKIDTCPREALESWAAHLRTQHPTLFFRSATSFLPAGPELVTMVNGKVKGKEKAPVNDGLGVDSVLACLSQWAREKKGTKSLTVAVVGPTNVGKSAFVNSLLRKSALPVYTLASSSRGPSTTALPQEVTLEIAGKQIRLIDTPGLSWETDASLENVDDIRARDILLRSKGRIDRLRDPLPAVAQIVARSNSEDLMLLYSLPAFAKGDPNAFLAGVARANQLIKKKGELDITGACRIVLKDWTTGKFPRYATLPPNAAASAVTTAEPALEKIYAGDGKVLGNLKTRKKMRKSGGLVKFVPGEVDSRKLALEEPWSGLNEGGDSSSGEEDEVDELDEEEDGGKSSDEEDELDEEDEDEEEEEEPPAPPPSKQKRKRVTEPAPGPPSKKVAFAADPKNSKQSRKAGSLKAPVDPKPKAALSSNDKVATTKGKAPRVAEKKEKKVANSSKKTKPSPAASGKAAEAGSAEAYNFSNFF